MGRGREKRARFYMRAELPDVREGDEGLLWFMREVRAVAAYIYYDVPVARDDDGRLYRNRTDLSKYI